MRQTTSPSGGKGDANKFFPFHCHRFPYQPFATSHKPLLYLDHHGPVKKTVATPRKATAHPTFLSMIQVSSCFVVRVWFRLLPTRLRACLRFGLSLVHHSFLCNRNGKMAFEWLLIVNWAIWSYTWLHPCSNNYDIPMWGCKGNLTRSLPPV